MSTATIPPTPRKSFGSDNHAGVHPAIMRAIVDANSGDAIAYGADPWTEQATGELKRLAGASGEVYLVLNGSGANVLGLGLLLDRHEAVICADSAHIKTDECGAPERILGTKLLTVPAPNGKITPELIESRLAGRGDDHFAQPSVVCVTQSTEYGTCYSLTELADIHDFCAAHGLKLYLDGARLANATAYLNCTLAELARHVDVFSFGGTQNGAMAVEALVVMREAAASSAPYLRKQHMQLASKMRFLGAQLGALLSDDLWLRNAAHANAMAARLADGLAGIPGVEVVYPVQSDAVFARLDGGHIAALSKDWTFHVWDEQASVVRWMTAYDTQEPDVDEFLAAIAATAGS
ncbi:MAG TPA: beta-eliminating lyase-related protein [Trebonia sp.]